MSELGGQSKLSSNDLRFSLLLIDILRLIFLGLVRNGWPNGTSAISNNGTSGYLNSQDATEQKPMNLKRGA